MKKITALLIFLLSCSAALCAQDTSQGQSAPKKADLTQAVTPLRVQVVFTEFDGEKKIASLPYTFLVNADERRTRPNSQVRNGARIPVAIDKDKISYIDLGTSIDCSAMQQDDGRFKLTMNFERSSISETFAGWAKQDGPSAPAIHQFRAEINPVLKDGQTTEGIATTDPLTGHVYRVSVTLNVVK